MSVLIDVICLFKLSLYTKYKMVVVAADHLKLSYYILWLQELRCF